MLVRQARKFLVLPRDDQATILRAFLGIAWSDLGLHFLRLDHVVARAEHGQATGAQAVAADLERARRYGRWIEVASRFHPVKARCLHRALTLHRWLRKEHLPSRLRIGVRKVDGQLIAHAWVELAGEVIDDRADAIAAYAPLSSGRVGRWA